MSLEEFLRLYPLRSSTLAWFLGAGASASARLPTAWDLAWRFKQTLYCTSSKVSRSTCEDLGNEVVRERLQRYLDSTGKYPQADSPEEYATYFEATYPDPNDAATDTGDEMRCTAHSWLTDVRTFFTDLCTWALEPDSPFLHFAPSTVPLTRHSLLGLGFDKARERTRARITATVLDLEREMPAIRSFALRRWNDATARVASLLLHPSLGRKRPTASGTGRCLSCSCRADCASRKLPISPPSTSSSARCPMAVSTICCM
ncbi:MAG: integrase family protein [Edaphobacter sp.]|nr:integrase family protein [Edaphobacter sp.]